MQHVKLFAVLLAVAGLLSAIEAGFLNLKPSLNNGTRKRARILTHPEYNARKLRQGKRDLTVTILHTSDIHSHYEEFNSAGLACSSQDKALGNCYGGYARLKEAIKLGKRDSTYPVYVVDAGDHFQGTIFYNKYHGAKLPRIVEELQYDVITLGNHEFDDGFEYLVPYIRSCPVPIVNCNLDLYAGALHNFSLHHYIKPFVVLKHGVAFIGSLTPTVLDLAIGARGVIIGDAATTIQNQVNELHRQGINRIVVLSHNGINDDLQIARQLSGVSLIVGGHSHTLLANNQPGAAGPYPVEVLDADGNVVRIVHSGCWGKYLGRLTMSWNADGRIVRFEGEPLLLDQTIPEDPELKQLITTWKAPIEELLRRVVGTSSMDLLLDGCLEGECALGNLYARILYDYVAELLGESQLDFCFVNTKGIRAGVRRGPITMDALYAIVPFDNEVTTVKLSGAAIVEIFENVGSKLNRRNMAVIDSNVQIHNIRYVYSSVNPGHLIECTVYNSRIGEWEPIEREKVYTAATSSFLSYGGDNIITPAQPSAPSYALIRDAFIKWFERNTEPVSVTTDGRIMAVDDSSVFYDD